MLVRVSEALCASHRTLVVNKTEEQRFKNCKSTTIGGKVLSGGKNVGTRSTVKERYIAANLVSETPKDGTSIHPLGQHLKDGVHKVGLGIQSNVKSNGALGL